MPETRGEDNGLPYQETTEPRYADEAAASFQVETYGKGLLLLRGPCPRCQAVIDVPVVDEIVRTYSAGRVADDDTGATEVVEPVMCTCTQPHTGRPEGMVGCGAFWNFIL